MTLRRPRSAMAGLALVAITACSPATPATPIPTGEESPATERPGGSTGTPLPSSDSAADRPQVEKVAGCSLLTEDEVWDAFGFDKGGQVTRSSGESCEWQIKVDDVTRASVRIGPGAPDDFEVGASLDELTSSERVDGIGLAARWFAGDGTGTLTVVQDTDLGYQFYRLAVDQPELDGTAIMKMATDFAAIAGPRFPGAQTQTVTFDREVPDARNASLAENILAREASGEWTRAEGLVATLKVLANELPAEQVLPEGGIVDGSASGVLALARDYLEQGSDAAAKVEIARLLDILVLTRADLEQMTAGQRQAPGPGSASTASLASLHFLQDGEQCEAFGEPGPCMDEWVSPELDTAYGVGKYRMYTLHGDLGAEVGWTDQHYFWAMDALIESAKAFEALGTMPKNVTVSLWPWGFEAYSAVDDQPDDCQVDIYRRLQEYEESKFKQWIAGDIAHCFIAATFPGRQANYETWRWWNHALAVYLSNVVYPAPKCTNGSRCDFEWFNLPGFLAGRELATTLFNRSSDNAIFFQWLGDTIGNAEIVKLVRTLPAGGDKEAHRAALAGYTGMDALFHQFILGLTDADIPDSGGESVPYQPRAWNLAIDSAPLHIVENPPPFGTSRIDLIVATGQTACMEYSTEGDVIQEWRTSGPGVAGAAAGGSWSYELPKTLQGEAVLVSTTMKDGAQVSITVNDVVADPSDCQGQSAGGSGTGGKPCFCAPSDYYELKKNLQEWIKRIVSN